MERQLAEFLTHHFIVMHFIAFVDTLNERTLEATKFSCESSFDHDLSKVSKFMKNVSRLAIFKVFFQSLSNLIAELSNVIFFFLGSSRVKGH